ncbi:hypothetical protein [Brasilonema bromeliae]|uniref:Uncharacterized protein n=1 Tax=Brasilonema bromeliae SPC951 TaxID=385972 RepID=A0ABX1P3J4_9CYAN|nr:hypothetical protein [Brasilonema bromeliae]KAB8332494.1 hypothetical protein SD80_018010 [Scytonema tolypothrichoides VB-61278]NMG18457.1 hypothetical protein [Brasilonema bromeliae SPC951]
MPHYFSTQPTTDPSNTHSKGSTDAHTNNLIGLSIISFPLFVLLGIITYKKSRVAVYRRRIAFLEKIWLMDVKNNTYRQD